jgi:hypothetical protein
MLYILGRFRADPIVDRAKVLCTEYLLTRRYLRECGTPDHAPVLLPAGKYLPVHSMA